MGCSSSQPTVDPKKIVPLAIQDKISISPVALSCTTETYRFRRKVNIEVIHHEHIIANSEVNHLGQLANPPQASTNQLPMDGKENSIKSDMSVEDAAAKKKQSAKKKVPIEDSSQEKYKSGAMDKRQKEMQRYAHVLKNYPNYEYLRKEGDGSLGEVIVVRDKESKEEVTLYV